MKQHHSEEVMSQCLHSAAVCVQVKCSTTEKSTNFKRLEEMMTTTSVHAEEEPFK